LTNASTSSPKPPLWFDIYALQMMFSEHEYYVYFSPVYGCLIEQPDEILRAYPQVPPLLRAKAFQGLSDYELLDLPSSFTIVPIFALNTLTFGVLSHSGGNNSHLEICQELTGFDPDSGKNVNTF
jgi:hypothetical protein